MDQIVLTPVMVFHMLSMDLESSLSSTGEKKHFVLSVCWLMFLIACLAETQFNSPDLLWWMCPPWSLPDVPDVTCFCSVLVRVGIATASRSKQAKGSWELGFFCFLIFEQSHFYCTSRRPRTEKPQRRAVNINQLVRMWSCSVTAVDDKASQIPPRNPTYNIMLLKDDKG